MKKQIEEMVDVRGHDQMVKDSDEIVYSEHSGEYILKTEALENVSVDYGIIHEDFLDDFREIKSRDNLRYSVDDIVYSEVMDEHIHDDDAEKSYCGDTATNDYFNACGDYYYIDYGRAQGEYLHYELATHCEDIGEHVHNEDAHYCDYDDEYYYEESEMPRGIFDRGCLNEYHNGPPSDDLSKGAQFRIGFEIEKNEINGVCNEVGDEIGYYNLIARFETDSSCGYDGDTGVEAITHILPLSGVRSKRRKEVFEMMDQAASVINEECSGSCGGHITISAKIKPKEYKTYSSIDLLEKMRGNLGIMYALYRFRLNNSYCATNKGMKKGHHGGSCVVQLKSGGAIEIRLPSRVANTRQLKLRYDLMYILVRRSLDGTAYSKILKEVKPIIVKMYNKDKVKVKYILDLAKHFRKYLISDHISDEINEFINGTKNEEEE